jgi:glycosyltransferase involved in cell wall biosynthesis
MDMLQRVLESCVSQRGLSADDEILIVDSGSSPHMQLPPGFSGRVRLVREAQAGLAQARARGIRETTGEVIVFLDDDTVLAPDYLERAVKILAERPYLGVIGGQLLPEFEGPLLLPERYYWERLPLRSFSGDHWSNRWDDFATSPIGGGMVIRRSVAEEWARQSEAANWRRELGRTGKEMGGAEDVDQNRTACQMGLGKGVFAELKLTHIIPQERMKPEFLVKMTEGNTRSWAFIRGMVDSEPPIPPRTLAHRIKIWMEAFRKRGLDRQLLLAEDRGTWQGWKRVAHERQKRLNHLSS